MTIATPDRRFAPISIAKTLRIALVLAVLGILLWKLADALLLGFAAVFLAVVLRAAADGLHHYLKLPRGLALAVVCLIIAGAVVGFCVVVGPRIAEQGSQLVSTVGDFVQQAKQQYAGTPVGKAVQSMMSGKAAATLAPVAPKVLSLTFGGISGFVLLIVTALYLAAAPPLYVKGALYLVPPSYRARGQEILEQAAHVLRYWMLGQLIDMAVVGILTTVGLLILHVPLAIALGVLAGALTFIPYFGAIIAAIPALIVAASVSPVTILYVVLVYTLCHLVEGYVVAPIVMRRTVHLPPAITVLAMFTMGSLYGFTGVLVATPLAAALIVFVKEIYVKDMLGNAGEESMLSENHSPFRRRRALPA